MATDLQRPVTVWQMPEHWRAVVQRWVRDSLSVVEIEPIGIPPGTVLLRTGGPWDSLVGFADCSGRSLTPLMVFKNPVPLWQYAKPPANGEISQTDWPRLRRTLLLHNPGLDGFFTLVDRVVSMP